MEYTYIRTFHSLNYVFIPLLKYIIIHSTLITLLKFDLYGLSIIGKILPNQVRFFLVNSANIKQYSIIL